MVKHGGGTIKLWQSISSAEKRKLVRVDGMMGEANNKALVDDLKDVG